MLCFRKLVRFLYVQYFFVFILSLFVDSPFYFLLHSHMLELESKSVFFIL